MMKKKEGRGIVEGGEGKANSWITLSGGKKK